MRLRLLSVGLLLSLAEVSACKGTHRAPDECPVTTLTLDAGVDGLPDIGEYARGQICESLCGAGLTVCRRVEELVLKCQPECE